MSFTTAEPVQLVSLSPVGIAGFVTHGVVTGAPGVIAVSHGTVTGGPFEPGRTLTSTSGGTGIIAVVVDANTVHLTGVAGACSAPVAMP